MGNCLDLFSGRGGFSAAFQDSPEWGVYTIDNDQEHDPDDVAQAWDREFDTRPDWFDELVAAREVWYVGATNDCLSRLEDHRDGEVRVGVLQRICAIESLRNVWWFSETDRAFERESGIAVELQNHYPDVFVRQG